MPTYTLPNTVTGGSISVNAGSLAEAQQQAANQTGVSLAQQQGGGTYGANTYGPGATPGAGTPGTPGMPQQVNLDAQTALFNAANQAALIAYYNSKLALDTDELAFRKATQAFQNTIAEAGVTGMYQGQPTLQAQLQAANLLGTYQGQTTLAAQEQAFRQALAAETQRQQAAQSYLNLVAGLRGPADYGQYLKTLASTPQGLSDLVRSAAGQYVPGVGTTGAGITPVSLAGVINQISGGAPGATPGTLTATGPVPLGVPGTATAAANTAYQQYMQQAQNLPAPNQIAPAAWNAYSPTQRQLLLGMYEQMGWNPQDVQNLYASSLPKYALNAPQAGTFRLV